ncbi:MAG: AmmeMemoRadiSam system protein A [Desulfuromonadaceae bacterium]|nr:AmmeMemoRadiSam system protein A [Desulfuromonadaceae bacterium]
MSDTLNPAEREILLAIARHAIETVVRTGRLNAEEREEPALNRNRGCFVTIRRRGELRGCIGTFVSGQPLWREVAAMAASAATRDPRFQPMKERELADFSVEISVLSPLEETDDPNRIEVGKHGVYLENGFNRGVLLPQVAVEHGWDRLTFLQQTCLKAGLPADSWNSPQTRLYLFTAEILTGQ